MRKLWVDRGYRGAFLDWAQNTVGWDGALVKRPSRWGRYPEGVEPPPLPAFTVLPRHRVVERTFGWLGLSRRLSKDDERLPETGEAWIYAAMSRLLLRRLTRQTVPWPQAKAA